MTDKEIQQLRGEWEKVKNSAPIFLSSEDTLVTVRPERAQKPTPLRPFQNCGCFPYHVDRETLYCMGYCKKPRT